tara:strand:+ start:315 stop:1460 length:1146 start_codon:yes stop_codon:yes gene_type:complete
MKKLYFITIFIIIDLLLSQLFLLKFLENDIIKANKDSFENRIFNKNYNYTFKKQVQFTSQYDGNVYEIFTNDLGFRDESTQPLDRDKEYSIIIGDSFVEGVGLDYKDTIVGILNENLANNEFKLLNAGVASYSSYIYLKKIKTIIQTNQDLLIKDVIVFLDKSDVLDDELYLSKPEFFTNTKGKFINKRKEDFYKDLKELSFWRFFTKQTISGNLIKILTNKLEDIASNIAKRYSLSKKLNKSFFKISNDEIRAIKSIQNKPHVKNWYLGKVWQEKSKKNINFAINNLDELKKFLDQRNINLKVVLYPWSFEIENEEIRKKYLNYIIPLLNKKNIETFVIYDDFLSGNIYENIGKSFLYNDIHYNKNGNEIIANFLIKNLN